MSFEATVHTLAKITSELMLRPTFIGIPLPVFEDRKSKNEQLIKSQLELVKELSDANINPDLFDKLLSNEIDRMLKRQYANFLLLLAVTFALLAYAIIVLNAIYEWDIPDVAITALIIETPIQFIGLLYIVVRNLFPQSN